MKIGVGYIRMSTDRQEASPEMQKGIVKEYAAQNDIKIVKWYEDLAISGGSLKNRTSMMELIFDAEKKLFETVLFFKYDRAFRNVEEQSVVLNKFEKLGIEYKAIKDPEGDGASGRLIRNILGAINQFERELTGERIFYHNREKRKQGKWTGGGFPLGYDYDENTKCLKIVPEEAEIAVLIKDLYLQYKSCGKVAQELRIRNILTKNGNIYNNETISYILKNPTYIGKLRWNHRGQGETEVFEGNHEAIWSEDEFNQIQNILNRNKYNNFGNKRFYLLTTLLICGKCGYKMKACLGGHTRNRVLYKCTSRQKFGHDFCDMLTMRSDVIDPIVESRVIKNIKRCKLESNTPNMKSDNKTSKSEIERLEKLIEKHKNLYLMDIIDELELKRKINEFKKQIETLKVKQTPKSFDNNFIEILRNFEDVYYNVENIDKKELLCSIVDKIVVHNRYDFTIHFKELGFKEWEKEEKVTLDVTKKWISDKEKQRLFLKYLK